MDKNKKHNRIVLVFWLSTLLWMLIYGLIMKDILTFNWGWIAALCVIGIVIATSAPEVILYKLKLIDTEHAIETKEQNYLSNSDEWRKIEDELEGKTISTVASNDVGIIIRFTDGAKLSYIKNELCLENNKEVNMENQNDNINC